MTTEPAPLLLPLTEWLFLVPGERRGHFPRSHSFYVRDEVCALIDTGCGLDRVRAFARAHRVDLVINSHGHPDHCAGNFVLRDDVPIYAPAEGADTHGRLGLLSHRFARPGPLAQMWRAFIRELMGFEDRAPTHTFADGHVFDFGHQRLTAIHNPGHTADHYIFWDSVHGVLLSFDIDLTSFGPYYGHRESDLGTFRRSIAEARALGAHIVASSHREPIEGGADVAQALDDFAAVFERREAEILGLVPAGGATLAELTAASPIYGGHPLGGEVIGYWEGLMIADHLAELEARGALARDGDRYLPTR